MSHVIEAAKSGRAGCRKCKEKIAKDELRFGHEIANDFSDSSYQWYHLKCAAMKVPIPLAEALADCDLDIPDRTEIDQLIAENRKKQKPTTFPYAEVASTGRSSCIVCDGKIDKGALRIAIEREVDAGGFMRRGAGYLHPGCAMNYEEIPDDLMEEVRANSPQLDPAELDEIEAAME
ncbi:MAG: hypothetical protein KDB14_11770 [Planctomycetales bacterium]|nr:hypothetical protein [Planctomycetales bacterium]